MTTTDASPYRSRFRVQLASPVCLGITALMLVAGVIWLRMGLPICRQQLAIREISRVGGRIETVKCGPNWVRKWVGDELMTAFDEVVVVDLTSRPATDATLAHVGRFTKLQRLRLSATNVTDAGLIHLQALTMLDQLSLEVTAVTDGGLAHIESLTSLQDLSLDFTQITDDGLAHLENLAALRKLSFDNTQVSDVGTTHLKGHTLLRRLSLHGTLVTDKGLQNLRRLINLEHLALGNGPTITDAGVAELERALPGLTISRPGLRIIGPSRPP
jgi:hypothetical protein